MKIFMRFPWPGSIDAGKDQIASLAGKPIAL